MFALEPLVRRVVSEVLSEHLAPQARGAVLADAWLEYTDIVREHTRQPTLGAEIMTHLSARTIGLYRVLMRSGLAPELARDATARVNWGVYDKLVALPWAVTGGGDSEPLARVKRAMDLFMTFPYGAPGYQMAYVEVDPATVGFDVTRCPAAELFAAQGHADLCKAAFCDLDYPLAERWGVELDRQTTLAEGHDRCRFRFRALEEE